MTASSSDLVALEAGRRLRIVAVVRLVVAATLAAVFAAVGEDLVDPGGLSLLAGAAAVHVAVNAVVLLVPAHRLILDLSIVVDAAVLAVVLAVTGGPLSPLAVLIVVPVAALTLTFGARAGVRTGAAFTTAMVWVLMTVQGAVRPTVTGAPPMAVDPTARTVAVVAGVWVVVASTALLVRVTERQLRQIAEDLETLRDVVTGLDPRRGPQEVAEQLTDAIVTALGYTAASLWLPTGTGLDMAAGAGSAIGPSEAMGGDGAELTFEDMPDLSDAPDGLWIVPRSDPRAVPLVAVHGDRAPLVLLALRFDDGRPPGLLAVQVSASGGRARVRGRDLRLLRQLATESAVLLDTARVDTELRRQALTDGLTGLANHRYLQQRLPEEVERAVRRAESGHPSALSFALFDLDHFKSINDRYGHPVGDRALRAVAEVAGTTVRTSDVVCRYGGEEFGVILIDTDRTESVLACERLRHAIAGLTVTTEDGAPIGPVTASFGVATRSRDDTVDGAELIAAADEALYAAKHAGRNRVVHHDTVVPEVVDISEVRPEPDLTLP